MELNPRIPGHLAQLKAEECPDTRILTFENGDQPPTVVTYRTLWENSAKLAHSIVQLGLRPGDRVAIFMRNYPEFVYGVVATSITGTTFVPIDPRQKGEKLRYQLVHAECRAALTTTDLLPVLEAVAARTPGLGAVIASQQPGGPTAESLLGGRIPVRRLDEMLDAPLREAPDQRVQELTHPLQVIYTSGTTGDPKGVVGDTGRFTATAGLLAACFGYRPDDRLYTGLSLTHGNAQAVTLLPALQLGIEAVFSAHFTKSRIWDICRRFGCTTFSLLGGMMAAIYAEPPRPDDADNPVRMVLSAGTPRAIWEAFEHRFRLRILEWYGAVEGGFAYKPIGEGPIGAFGKPIEGLIDMKIVDQNDEECPPGTIGELVSRVRGVETRVEYLKNPEASAAKTRGGWLRSGDMCYRDADGWLFFSHRKGAEIRHNGEFIQPDFIQKVIAEQPSVSDVYVYGIPARSGAPGERDVVAAVALAPGARLDPTDFIRACATHLERNQIPSFLQILPEIPKTASEKPQDRFLLEALEKHEGCEVHDLEELVRRIGT